MLTQKQHRIKFQAKTVADIQRSPLTLADEFQFPSNSVIHYLADTLSEYGMKGNNTALYNWDNEIFLTHVTEEYGSEGKPKIIKMSQSIQQEFFKNQTRLRRIRNLERMILKPKNMIVFDYSLLPHKLNYSQSIKQNYFEFANIAVAYENTINKTSKDRNNFIMVTLPDNIPAKSRFAVINDEVSNVELETFTNTSLFWLRELWLAAEGKSLLNRLSNPENVNFLLFDDGAFISLNLGLFLEYADTKASTAQKGLLKLLEGIVAQRSPVEETDLPTLQEGETVSYAGASNELKESLARSVQQGVMTAKESERFIKITENTLTLKSPIGDGTVMDAVKSTPEELLIPAATKTTANKLTVHPSDTLSTTSNLRKTYIEKSLDKDILKSILSLNKLGVIVKDVKRELVLDAANDNSVFIISFVMPNGKPGTRRLRIPNIKPNGLYKANNVLYTSDYNKVDIPIRKVSPSRVSLTSYYGKIFINRSDRATEDYGAWLVKNIIKMSHDVKDKRVIGGRMGSNRLPTEVLPRDYTSIMAKVSEFTTGSFIFNFEHSLINERYSEDVIKRAKKLKLTLCGISGTNPLAMDKHNIVYVLKKDTETELSTVREIIGGEWGKVPVDRAVVSVFGKKTPLGLVLGRYLGLDALIKRTKIKHRIVPSNIRSSAEKHEFEVKFKDSTYYFDKSKPEASMILAGFLSVAKQTPMYNSHEFNKPEVYTTVLLNFGLHTLAIRELQLTYDGFVDHITEEILTDMKEPTDIVGLYFRAVELLKDDVVPESSQMRLRGYERISGFLYKTFVDAVRMQRGSPNPKNATLDIRTNAVWQMLVGDATTQLAQSINPVHSLKEQEGVSLSGEGGQTARSLVKKSRVFQQGDVGIFSESTPDSAKVAIRTFLTPNAAVLNSRGIMGVYDPINATAGALSTTSNLLPAANHDDKVTVVFKSL